MNKAIVISYYTLVAVVSAVLVSLVILLIIIICKKKSPLIQSEEGLDHDHREHTVHKSYAHSYPFAEIDVATDGFNHKRIIGKGRLGTAYAAILANGDVAVVKRINPRFVLGNAGFGFSSLVKSLSLAQHPNIVPILGFSEAPGERIILMEFMGMKSLDFYLHQDSIGASILDWQRRLKIAAGAARGLEYLHEGTAPYILHGCVKPSNILIDENFGARLCDYGISFLASQEKKGLLGYVDNEYWDHKNGGGGRGGPCKASDVYGFGVVLLEILSGRRCEEGLLVQWALPLIRNMRVSEVLDPKILVPLAMKPLLLRLCKVASACVGNVGENRPSIAQVAAILNSLEKEI